MQGDIPRRFSGAGAATPNPARATKMAEYPKRTISAVSTTFRECTICIRRPQELSENNRAAALRHRDLLFDYQEHFCYLYTNRLPVSSQRADQSKIEKTPRTRTGTFLTCLRNARKPTPLQSYPLNPGPTQSKVHPPGAIQPCAVQRGPKTTGQRANPTSCPHPATIFSLPERTPWPSPRA